MQDEMKLEDYGNFLSEVTGKINSTLAESTSKRAESYLTLHWEIGRLIVEMQENASWGTSVVEKLSQDLRKEFPKLKGFSRANLFFMRRWYLFYYKSDPEIQKLIRKIPWGHNLLIINKAKGLEEAVFYINKTIEHNWRREVLLQQVRGKLFYQ